MGYVISNSNDISHQIFEYGLLTIIFICRCSALDVHGTSQFSQITNGPLSDAETYLKQNIHQYMENGWKSFQLRYNKVYKDKETELDAKLEYFKNQIYVNEHNLRYAKNEVTYEIEINQFSDIKPKNVANILTKIPTFKDRKYSDGKKMVSGLPETVDWRLEGAVTHVKDQGQCVSGWAFSATGSLEGQLFRKNNYLTSLSEQNLIDCSLKYLNEGCHGGDMYKAFTYIYENGGINTEAEYPYTGVQGECKYQVDNFNLTDHGTILIEPYNLEKLQEAVATIGPISTQIDASLQSFRFYKRGVYSDPTCGENINHAVLIVGYGTDPVGGDYWLIKNSWGKSWGDGGYIKVARKSGEYYLCGIGTYAFYPHI